jgi:predicted nucleic acid-binding protein
LSSFVLDASVAVKWWLPAVDEPLVDTARWLFEQHRNGRIEFIGPDLLWPEVGSVLHKAVRRGRITSKQAERSLDEFLDSGVTLEPSAPLLRAAFLIASGANQSVYDAIYVALAMSLDRPLLTADRRLVNALGAQFPVRWLGSI